MKQYCLYSPEGPVEVTEEVYKAYYSHTNHAKYLRRKEMGVVVSLDKLMEDNVPAEDYCLDETDVEDQIIQNMIIKKIRELLPQLPVDQAKLLKAIYYDDCSMREIARQYGVSEGTIRHRHKKAIASLKNLLNED
jgi:RNA polymerase sigma factor (sigma-70 family)